MTQLFQLSMDWRNYTLFRLPLARCFQKLKSCHFKVYKCWRHFKSPWKILGSCSCSHHNEEQTYVGFCRIGVNLIICLINSNFWWNVSCLVSSKLSGLLVLTGLLVISCFDKTDLDHVSWIKSVTVLQTWFNITAEAAAHVKGEEQIFLIVSEKLTENTIRGGTCINCQLH